MTEVAAARLPDVPAGWTVVDARGPAGFTTHATLVAPDGARVRWTSRRHRKRLGLAGVVGAAGPAAGATAAAASGAALASAWRIGGLFAVGSVCFAVASVPAFVEATSLAVAAWTYFVGSIFFTSAAYLQYHEVLHAPEGVLDPTARPGPFERLVGWRPRRIDFWATAVQLVGTVLFNVSTFAGTRADLDVERATHLVWAPDVYGSICFLVASWLAYAEVNRGVLPRPDGSTGWWIGGLNLAGSVAFGASAVGARYTDTGDVTNAALVNGGTFLGAVCFLVGALLLPVEARRDAAAPVRR